ncbi:MAG: transcription-repair coupling factor [Eubacteriales bacterium]|nr:transcription-repair coupling factor [Eubacteriales bacterium]
MNIIFKQILNSKEASALPGLREGGRLPALISGLSAVHRANLAAALEDEFQGKMFVVCPDDTSAENFAADLRAMLDESIEVLGMRDFSFYPLEAASRQAEQNRIKTLYSIAGNDARITVASIAGLMQRTIPADILLRTAFSVENGGTIPPEDVEDALIRCGYSRADQVEGPGQFSRRGGILDFFSPASEHPVRIEFWGDEVDSMAYFDVQTQRRDEQIDKCLILPAAEVLPTLTAGGVETLCREIDSFADRYSRRRNSGSASDLAKTMHGDAEKMRNGIILSDSDRYLPLIYPPVTGADYIPEDAVVFFDQPNRCAEKARDYSKRIAEEVRELGRRGLTAASEESYVMSFDAFIKKLREFPVYMADAFTVGKNPIEPQTIVSIPAKQLPSYAGNAQAAAEDAKQLLKSGYSLAFLAGDERRAEILSSYLNERDIHSFFCKNGTILPENGKCVIYTGSVSAGMEYPGLKLAILTDSQIIRKKGRTIRKKLPAGRQKIESYSDLSVGDYIVHENHGIGRFTGIIRMEVDGYEKDYIKIAYAGSDVLYVPATQLDMVTKYTGVGENSEIRLSKMGGADWEKRRSRAKGAAKDMAEKLIALYAERLKTKGYAFSPDSDWQNEFEENFEYIETDDQLKCISEIKKDMESSVPMDRLLCGDVGFGKTEVALRAVMKCVLDGKQAAILCPTTVLARQHYQTALQRFFGFPVTIELLSRFTTGSGASSALKDISSGKCDLLIGTHRILSKDVKFKNLGLLVVDEEQRFGVTHKEHIKELSKGVDVLTLSATPIPRTMNMALSGIRDMSTIEEPPEDRLPVQTFVMEHNWDILADAITRELQRGGQVYYLHNRIEDIERTARKLSELLGNSVTIGIGHGKMDRQVMADVMDRVASGDIQVLVCTTIIETGIDIPNVNTLIIEDADRLGLAQLHQIRGRVGRSSRKASAYLTFRRDKVLTEDAEKRLNAIRDFAAFGSGMKIAMRDLEIRGAGNLLGAEQSGHMEDVGYDMYMKLLNEAVLEAKGEEIPVKAECSADLAVAANIPDKYISSSEQRMDIYRRIAMIKTEEEADDILDELIDRYGDPPPGVSSLIQIALLRGEAGTAGITDISQKQGNVNFTLKDFDMGKVSLLYNMESYKKRLKVVAGSKPCLSLKIMSKSRVIDEARKFIHDWENAEADPGTC